MSTMITRLTPEVLAAAAASDWTIAWDARETAGALADRIEAAAWEHAEERSDLLARRVKDALVRAGHDVTTERRAGDLVHRLVLPDGSVVDFGPDLSAREGEPVPAIQWAEWAPDDDEPVREGGECCRLGEDTDETVIAELAGLVLGRPANA